MYKEVNKYGHIFYYKDAEMTIRHREDGPACEYAGGTKIWCLNHTRHRIDGPAVEHPDGDKGWYLDGKCMGFQEWKQEVRKYYDSKEDYLLMLFKLD